MCHKGQGDAMLSSLLDYVKIVLVQDSENVTKLDYMYAKIYRN
jgi:hypothetical protein